MDSTEIKRFVMDNGTINYGLLMRYWRKQVMRWKNAQMLADVYNEVLKEDEPLTARTIQRMEQQNAMPIDPKRRWLLATILNIPPAYLGLTALAPYKLPLDVPHIPIHETSSVDISEYTRRLQHLWLRGPSYSQEEITSELLTRIHVLQDALLYSSFGQRDQLASLLCQYLLFCGNTRRDQGYSDSAIVFLDKAIKLADEKGYYELGAKAFYLKGYAQFDKWGIQQDRMTERANLQQAQSSFQSALQLAEMSQKQDGINGPLKSAIVAELGLAQAYNAQTGQERKSALHTIDKASSIIQSSAFRRDPLFLHINDEWYHIDKAEAYVALQQGYQAVDELTNVDRSNAHTRRRYVYTDIVEADAYLTKGMMEMSVACAENALDLLKDRSSFTFVVRIANIYHELRQNEKYANSPDVARLGGKLLKVQHAYLFE